MWLKIIISGLMVLLLFIFQVTLLSGFGSFLAGFNLILIILTLLVNLTDERRVFAFALLIGWLMDIYSSLPFGIFLVTIFLTALVLEILLLNFFTNRSFYSLILMGLIAVLIYHLLFLIIVGSIYLFGMINHFVTFNYFWLIFRQLIGVTISLALCFWFINWVSKSFKPTFLKS